MAKVKKNQQLANNLEKPIEEPSIEINNEDNKIEEVSLDELDSIDNQSQSKFVVFANLIKRLNLRMGSDLSHIEIPSSFILPWSALDLTCKKYTNNFELLIKANKTEDELERLLWVYKYLITTLLKFDEAYKRPLNAVVGESQTYNFHVTDIDKNEKITDNYGITEQISEYPLVTGGCVYNKREGIKFNSYNTYKMTFHGTHIKVPIEGQIVVQLEKHDEVYHVELPQLHSRFLRSFVEYSGPSKIISSKSKYYIEAKYIDKPLIGGSYNSFETKVFDGESDKPIYKIQGQWDGESKITDCKTNETKPFFKANFDKKSELFPEILPTDSTIVWKDILESVSQGKQINMGKEKAKVINLHKKLNWKPIHFIKNEKTGFYEPKVYKD